MTYVTLYRVRILLKGELLESTSEVPEESVNEFLEAVSVPHGGVMVLDKMIYQILTPGSKILESCETIRVTSNGKPRLRESRRSKARK